MSEALLALDKVIEPGGTAFFFAGHGFEIHGQNYLLPTDVPAVSEGEEELIRDAAFPADRIIERLQTRGARTAILVLDACRNNPFERPGARGVAGTGGLAPMTPVEGVFVLFSAGAKQVALDALSRNDLNPNSVFTRNLIPVLGARLTLVQVAKRIQAQVKQAAAAVGHEQTPAYYDQVVGEIVLSPPAKSQATPLVVLPSAIAKSPSFPSLRSSQKFPALRAAIGLDAFGRRFDQGHTRCPSGRSAAMASRDSSARRRSGRTWRVRPACSSAASSIGLRQRRFSRWRLKLLEEM